MTVDLQQIRDRVSLLSSRYFRHVNCPTYLDNREVTMSIRVSRALPRVQKVPPLKSQDNELWRQLCERAANEQDPTKLIALATEICRLWDEKFKQPERKSPRRDIGSPL